MTIRKMMPLIPPPLMKMMMEIVLEFVVSRRLVWIFGTVRPSSYNIIMLSQDVPCLLHLRWECTLTRRLSLQSSRKQSSVYVPPNPNPRIQVSAINVKQIVNTFWDEVKALQKGAELFDKSVHWKCADTVQGKFHLWHKKHSLPYTLEFGFVAWCVTMKTLCLVTGWQWRVLMLARGLVLVVQGLRRHQ